MNEQETATIDTVEGAEITKAPSVMDAFVEESPARPQVGELVEGKVSAIGRARVFVDLFPW
ncbi:MAG: hypothetical protein RLZZ234_655, partial [Candidatus Parcubacteria bacterium]